MSISLVFIAQPFDCHLCEFMSRKGIILRLEGRRKVDQGNIPNLVLYSVAAQLMGGHGTALAHWDKVKALYPNDSTSLYYNTIFLCYLDIDDNYRNPNDNTEII